MLNKYNYDIEFGLYLKPATKVIIDIILKHVNKRGLAFPSQETIAKWANTNVRTVQRHVAKIKDFKIGGLPFVFIHKKRRPDGTWDHNVYYFPWLDGKKSKDYIKGHHLEIVNTLIKEYEEEFYKQIYDNNHTTKSPTNSLRDRISIYYIRNLAKKLSTILKIGQDEVFRVLASMGERLVNGDIIYNLDKYMAESFKIGKKQEQAKEKIQKIYQALLGTELNWYSVDWTSFANALN